MIFSVFSVWKAVIPVIETIISRSLGHVGPKISSEEMIIQNKDLKALLISLLTCGFQVFCTI